MTRLFLLGILTLHAVLVYTAPAFAGDCRASGTAIYYANGMRNSLEDAKSSLQSLKDLDLSILEADTSRIEYNLSYNQNERWWEEILKVWTQKVGTDYTAFWRVMFDLAPMPENLREWFATMLFNLTAASIHADDDLKAHLEGYKKELDDSRRFVVVSHSQGNLYTL
jgi:hypothetical protein